MRKVVIILMLLMMSGVFNINAQQTKILTADKHNEYGLIYSLPSTALNIRVTAVEETRKAGPFYPYAKKYAGTAEAVAEDSKEWRIESVTVTPYGVPDPEERYLMQLKPGALTIIAVDKDGMILSINTDPQAPKPLPKIEDEIIGNVYDGKEYLKFVGEEFVAAQSSAKQAQILSEELIEIRDAKLSLTRGTADAMPTDGRQLELMLNSLEQQENALMNAFLGSVTKRRTVRDFTFMPQEDGKFTLFRMSDFAGFVDANDYSGDPVNITVKTTNEGELPLDAKGEEKKMPKDGVAYCVPGAALITIEFKGEKLFSAEFEIAQFGLVFGLNPALFTDKKEPAYAIFDSATGALLELGTSK